MKAIIQNYRSGDLAVIEIPPPILQPGGLLVQNVASLVSVGTERSMVQLAKKNLINKARERPDLVRQVLDKARRDGIQPTVKAVRNRLDTPITLGYSCAGIVIAVAEDVDTFQIGDHVACAGAGFANHAEIVFVPKNLAVKLPDQVDFQSGAFVTLGTIALQGIRLADVRLGEVVGVIGLGLMGQLAVQMLRAAGCLVVGMDIQKSRTELALSLGAQAVATDAETFIGMIRHVSGGVGADAILIMAGTPSNEPVRIAGEAVRMQGIVVAVGAVGLTIPRKPYYDKEVIFRVSRSYGPGRYDPHYEEKGQDYPVGYVRWTENRNMQAVVQQLASGQVKVSPLITHQFKIEEALQAYELLSGKAHDPYMGIVLKYPDQPNLTRQITLSAQASESAAKGNENFRLGMLGAGDFATGTLLPELKKIEGVEFVSICTATGVKAQHVARKFGFRHATTDENSFIQQPETNAVMIVTRHHLHARQVKASLEAGKHVFCEKPLCLTEHELGEIIDVYRRVASEPRRTPPVLMVGYNRRFAPMSRQIKEFLTPVREPLVINYRVNAGYIPLNHWTQDPDQGGGRLVGEVGHFVDLLTYFTGALPCQVSASELPNNGRYHNDNLVLTIEFSDQSIGTITYVANGDKTFPKERIEIFGGGRVAVLDNFRQLELINQGKRRIISSRLNQDKGHQNELKVFVEAVKSSGSWPISLDELIAVSRTTFAAVEALRRGEKVAVTGLERPSDSILDGP